MKLISKNNDINKETIEILEKLKYYIENKSLPGDAAFSRLAPIFHNSNRNHLNEKPNKNTKNCSVLLLLSTINEELHIVFTLRTFQLISHSGQLCFPGGQSKISETPEETALRETVEEIGIKPYTIEILGKLTPIYILPSNSLITPVVGFSNQYLDFIINPDEVKEAFTIPISFFSFNNIKSKMWQINNEDITMPYWQIHPTVPLWGATAMILAEFLTIYENIKLVI